MAGGAETSNIPAPLAIARLAAQRQRAGYPRLWRFIIDRQLGREVAGVVQGGSVSWQLGRQRGLVYDLAQLVSNIPLLAA